MSKNEKSILDCFVDYSSNDKERQQSLEFWWSFQVFVCCIEPTRSSTALRQMVIRSNFVFILMKVE